MEQQIAKLLRDCKEGTIGRRRLLQALGLGATTAFGATALPKAAFGASAAQTAAA